MTLEVLFLLVPVFRNVLIFGQTVAQEAEDFWSGLPGFIKVILGQGFVEDALYRFPHVVHHLGAGLHERDWNGEK